MVIYHFGVSAVIFKRKWPRVELNVGTVVGQAILKTRMKPRRCRRSEEQSQLKLQTVTLPLILQGSPSAPSLLTEICASNGCLLVLSRLKYRPGEIEVGIAEGSAAWIEANSKCGRIRNQLSVDKSEAATQTVEVQAQTSVGDIVIRRAG